MDIFFTILFSLFCMVQVSAQIYNLPTLKTYRFSKVEFRDLQAFKNEVWHNGKPKVEFDVHDDSTAIRREYFPTGELKIVADVKYAIASDTMVSYPPGVYEEQIVIVEEACYPRIGEYIEYYKSRHATEKDSHIKSKGQYIDGVRVGEWQFKAAQSENKIKCNFDTDGKLSGDYAEFYYIPKSNSYSKKVTGAFARKKYSILKKRKSGKLVEYKIDEIVRSGKWQYYSVDGQLLQEVNHDWKLD